MNGDVLPFRRPPPVAAEMSDQALVAACGVGDAAALGLLFDRYAEHVYRFLGRLRGTDTCDLDDLLQATFIEVQRGASRFRGGAAVRTWVLGVAANVARHYVRGEIRRHAAVAAWAELPSRAPETPADTAERRQLLHRLGIALGELNDDLREAFVLCDLEDVPGVEAARVLGLRPGTLWRRLHDARRALRQAMEEQSS